MINPALRSSFIISIFSHFAIFSIFSLSFGSKIPELKSHYVSFWGNVLPRSQVAVDSGIIIPAQKKNITLSRPSFEKLRKQLHPPANLYLKPHIGLQAAAEMGAVKGKPVFKSASLVSFPKKKEQQILFHPLLPFGFTIYFKDRLIAHVELEFNIITGRKRNSVAVKRRVSSGNLEVDLLSKRYIERYLDIEQAAFTPDIWQAVKIDLSAKND